MGKELFEKRVIEEDTRILSTTYLNQDGYDLLVEQWFWDGIKAKSLIFRLCLLILWILFFSEKKSPSCCRGI
jgi:hypothetical protein